MKEIVYNNKNYPYFQALGNASQFAIPFAKFYCSGVGVDIGFCKEEWKFPGAIGAEYSDTSNDYSAWNLPKDLDYIYSSHCLEHLDCWHEALAYWKSKLKPTGVMFLYLPDPSQEYWLPWNNKKHRHILHCSDVVKCLQHLGFNKVISSGVDLNNSYMVVAYNE
jgi:SAM-dependent methyltransferase